MSRMSGVLRPPVWRLGKETQQKKNREIHDGATHEYLQQRVRGDKHIVPGLS